MAETAAATPNRAEIHVNFESSAGCMYFRLEKDVNMMAGCAGIGCKRYVGLGPLNELVAATATARQHSSSTMATTQQKDWASANSSSIE